WSKSPQVAAQQQGPAEKVRMTAELRAPRTQAGDTMELALTAHNAGTAPIYRLRAYTKSDNNVLDRREFVFGQLGPREKRTWTVPVKIPRYVPSRRDDVTVKWEDDQASALDELHAESDIAELPRPAFAWSWQLVSKEAGGGDGLLHKGEQVEMVIDVKNIGVGKAFDAFAGLKNLSEAGVLSNANEKANKIAGARKGAVLAAKGKLGSFYRVEWGKGRVGFVAAMLVKEAPSAHPSFAKVSAVQPHEPPTIRVANLD